MLALSPLRTTTSTEDDQSKQHMESFSPAANEDFPDLLESINFDDFFVGINDGDMLPDLEMDPEILAEFSVGREEAEMNTSVVTNDKVENITRKEEEDKVSNSDSGSGLDSSLSTRGEEIISKRDESVVISNNTNNNSVSKESDRGRKSSSTQAKNNQGKRKVKVDWTPELHRRFVQAVEQLGVDKAVPSRILELMGIDCLTRHNIASHLQKYRSHRKHLLAREAEAATWSHRRQIYGATGGGGGSGGKREVSPWHAPTIGFPPMTTVHHHHFRPLHVWGHPPIDQSLMHMWPKHLAHSPSPPPPAHTWPALPPDPSFWHQQQRVPNGLIPPGTPCFPQSMAPARFATAPVPGIPPHAMYKVDPSSIGVLPRQSTALHPIFDFYPSKESVDAAVGDVLAKPGLPLPLGLKPPSLDGVLGELQRQGVAKLPPTCTA
ncbi:hypothetical protein JCGZ_25739 [Jatropha curcas]|uniref:HTH myb-type domain-containing protein n=1 Tax=Jatropha curcas TaxID=180498 RepID=A0A067JJK9_JATCU|nr:transcription activator GLK1 [Jatropha curcas]KDP24082.1 hypothetical protein JCGZ_25739 [Jatropha curcas]